MGIKILTRAWKRGDEVFASVSGVKEDFAHELLFMGDIEAPKGIDIDKISAKKAAKYLEETGWRWVKIDPIEV